MQTEDKRDQIKSWFTTPKGWMGDMSPPISQGGCFLVLSVIFLSIIIIIIISQWSYAAHFGWLVLFREFFLSPLGMIFGGMSIITGVLYIAAQAKYITAKAKYNARKAEAKAKYDARSSTDQMIQWLEEDLETIKENSLHKIGLDESEIVAEPLLVEAPIRVKSSAKVSAKTSGKPFRIMTEYGYYLSRVWDITILYIGEKSFVLYQCRYDWTSDESLSESIAEYLYRDIATVERTSVKFSEIIIIIMNNGTRVQINLNGQNHEELSSRADKAARSIRRLLKDQ